MDFHRLARRELQALCKKNKIPANITNVAMVESLKALEIVEGIDELLPICESESAQSSIDSPVRSEVTSPCVPPTGGRTTRRRNATKGEPETAKPSIRSQRTTRRILAKDADEPQAEAIETPAIVLQTNRRRKGQMASACRKMDSQLKECVEEEKKDVLVSPAPSGVATRRRRGAKVESAVQRVYSTRRSGQLAEKNVELLNEVGNENPNFLNKELFANDCEELEMNMKGSKADFDEISEITGSVDEDENENPEFSKKELFTNECQENPNFDEASGITGAVDEDATMEENSEAKDKAEVVSCEKQETSSVNEVELAPTIEEETINHFEAEEAKLELKESNDVEIEEVGFGSEIEADLAKEKCDEREAPKSQENDESHDVQSSEIEIEVEKIEQQNTDEDAGCEERDTDKVAECEGQTANYSQNAVFESEDNFGISEVSCDIGDRNEIEKEESNDNDLDFEDVTDLNLNDEVLDINEPHDAQPSDIEIEVEKAEEEDTDEDAGLEDQATNWGENVSLESDKVKTVEDAGSDYVLPSEIGIEIEKTEERVTDKDVGYEDEVANCEENPKLEDSSSEKELKLFDSKAAEDDGSLHFDISLMNEEDEASTWDAVFAYVNAVEEEALPGKELNNVPVEIDTPIRPEEKGEKAPDQVPCLIQPTCFSSAKKKKRTSAVSDDKENIWSGSKQVITKERVKMAKEKTSAKNVDALGNMSMRQLAKMLKEKLTITNKPRNNENDNIEVPARPPLQALPENRNAN